MLQEYLSIDRTVSMSLLASEQYNVLKTASKHNATIYNISNKSQHSHSCKCHPPMKWSQVCMKLPYTDDLSYFTLLANIVPCHTHTPHTHSGSWCKLGMAQPLGLLHQSVVLSLAFLDPYDDALPIWLSFIHTHTIGGVIIDNALPTHLMMLYQLIWWCFTNSFDDALPTHLMMLYQLIWWCFTNPFDDALPTHLIDALPTHLIRVSYRGRGALPPPPRILWNKLIIFTT